MNIVITGATKGIGRAIAELYAGHGWNVAVCARTAADVEAMKDELLAKHTGIEVIAMACDAASKEALRTFADTIIEQWGRVDILVNNAGMFIPGEVTQEAEGVLENTIETNLYSAYRLTRYLLPVMTPQQKGHVFNMCSVASLAAYPNGGSYSISKFALLGFSKTLREELKPHAIGVTSIIPGAVLTPSWEGVDLPESRFIDVKDIATLVYEISQLSSRTVVEDIVIRPMEGDI